MLLPLGILAAMMAVSVPGAQAVEEHHYAGVLVKPGEAVGGSSHLKPTIGNIAAYYGGGQIAICEKVYNGNLGKFHRSCGINYAGNAANVKSWWGAPLGVYVENLSGVTHTIHGYYYTSYDRMGSGPIYEKPKMFGGEKIESVNGQYRFEMQSDGNAVVYNNGSGKACWSTKTNGRPGSYAYMQPDGNFVVYPGGVPMGGTPYWYTTATNGNPGAFMRMQNDGNLVIYTYAGNPAGPPSVPIWATSWITGQLGC